MSRTLATSRNRLTPGSLATFFSPYVALVKLYNPYTLFPGNAVASCSLYVGATTSVLALFALVRRPKSSWVWWVVGIALFFLAASLGDYLPLRGLLFDYFPPMRYFRHSALMRSYAMFGAVVLALLGARDVAPRDDRDSRGDRVKLLVSAVVLTVATFAVLLAFAFRGGGLQTPYLAWGFAHAAIVWLPLVAGAAIALLARERAWFRFVPILAITIAVADAYLTSVLTSQITFDQSARSVQRWRGLDASHVPSLDLTPNGLQRTETPCGTNPDCKSNRQLITKVPAFNAFSTEKNDAQQTTFGSDVLRGAVTGDDRVWFATGAATASAEDEHAVETLADRAEALGAPPLVVTSRAEMLGADPPPSAAGTVSIDAAPAMTRIAARVKQYSPDSLTLSVNAPSDGWLVVTDRWARGWSALVNDEPATIDCGNFLFRAVRVRAGPNIVAFAYRPFGIPWLVASSWLTLALVAGWSVYVNWPGAGGEPARDVVGSSSPRAETEPLEPDPASATPRVAEPGVPKRRRKRGRR